MTVPIEISDGYQTPGGRKSRTVASADKDVVVQIGNQGLTHAGLVKHIVGATAAVKVFCRHKLPVRRLRRTVRHADNRQA
jgi:hypothetical protein